MLSMKNIGVVLNLVTPDDDLKRFEDFIDGMTDMEYDIWYESDASSKQKEFADSVREEIQDDETPTEIQKNENQIVRFFRRLFRN